MSWMRAQISGWRIKLILNLLTSKNKRVNGAIWPLVLPFICQATPSDAVGIAIVALLFPAVIVFGGIWVLARMVGVFYGRKAAANVSSVYLIRIFDGMARFFIRIIYALFGAIRGIVKALIP
jgi:hypothetical protein